MRITRRPHHKTQNLTPGVSTAASAANSNTSVPNTPKRAPNANTKTPTAPAPPTNLPPGPFTLSLSKGGSTVLPPRFPVNTAKERHPVPRYEAGIHNKDRITTRPPKANPITLHPTESPTPAGHPNTPSSHSLLSTQFFLLSIPLCFLRALCGESQPPPLFSTSSSPKT